MLAIPLAFVALAAGCTREGTAEPPRPPAGEEASVSADLAFATTPSGTTLSLEVTRSVADRARGMMGRRSVPPGTGMLFIFDQPDRHTFWMKGCLIPLDIVWLDARGEVVDVAEKAPPCEAPPCPSYEPKAPARYVIEVGAGRARELGMVPGARVLLGGLDGEGRGPGEGA